MVALMPAPDSRSRVTRSLEAMWRSGRLPALIEVGTHLLALLMAGASYFIIVGHGVSQ